jgi:phage terminase large subunit
MREEYYKDKLGEKENKEERRRENSLDIIVYRFVEHRPIETDSIEKF